VRSEISADTRTGTVTWVMDAEAAEIYAGEIGVLGMNDAGFQADANDLFGAAEEIRNAERARAEGPGLAIVVVDDD